MNKLPLTSFEKYMILDDHPGYKMIVLMEWAFRGKINKELLIEAYKRTAKNEPLFRRIFQAFPDLKITIKNRIKSIKISNPFARRRIRFKTRKTKSKN